MDDPELHRATSNTHSPTLHTMCLFMSGTTHTGRLDQWSIIILHWSNLPVGCWYRCQVGISLSLLLVATGALLYIQVYYQLLFIFALQSIVLNIRSTLSLLHTFLWRWEILTNSKLLSSCAPLSLTFEGNSAIESDVSFLNEIGLDPGLDHLMAIELHKES